MAKRLFLVLSVVFVFSFLFVQVSEAVEYEYTVTKIGFHSASTEDPDAGAIIDLPSPVIIHEKLNEDNPNISNFVYQGNIPNGTWVGMSLYITTSTNPDYQDLPVWQHCDIIGDVTITESSRKLLTIEDVPDAPYPEVTVTDLQ